jgi:DNA-binding XRE family transcriptional regulator
MSDAAYYPPTMTAREMKRAREVAGMTRADLASALGLSERQIYRLEDGVSPITKRHELAINSALGTVRAHSSRPRSASKS